MNQVVLTPPIEVRLRPVGSRSTNRAGYIGLTGVLEGDQYHLEFHTEGKPPLNIEAEHVLAPREPTGWVYFLWRILTLRGQLQKQIPRAEAPDQRFETVEQLVAALCPPLAAEYRAYYRSHNTPEEIQDAVMGMWRSDLCGYLERVKEFQGELWLLDRKLTLMWDPVAYQRAVIKEQAAGRAEQAEFFRKLGPMGQAYEAYSEFANSKRRIMQRHQRTRCYISLYRALKSTRKILEDRLIPLIPRLPDDTRKAVNTWIDHRDEEAINCDTDLHVHIYDAYHAPKASS